jgi:uncharacterized protein YbaA (DUF1428 family)
MGSATKIAWNGPMLCDWIIGPSRSVRDQAMKKVIMADPRLKPDVTPMPFDGKRMIYGGFEMIVEA